MILNEVVNQIVLGSIFIIVNFLTFTLSGNLLLKIIRKNQEGAIENFVVSTVLGISIFTLSAYFFSSINLWFLIWVFPVLGIINLLISYKSFDSIFKHKIDTKWKKIFLAVLLIGIIGQMAVDAPSGMRYSEGIYFWSSHGHDGIWHIALIEEMKKHIFPFPNPEFAGHKIQNYHFFVDLLMSAITWIFPFSSFDVYFRFMPFVFSLLLGLSSFIFVKKWIGSEIAGIWAMVFTYFAGSFGYILSIPRNHNLSGETIFWVSQPQSTIGNPPHASAFIIITTFMFCFLNFLKVKSWQNFFLAFLIGGVAIEFKVYAGVLILGGLVVVGLWELMKSRNLYVILLFFSVLLLSLGIYLPNSVNSQDFLIWQPWWFIRTMVVAPDRLNWIELEERRQTYLAEHNFKRVIQVEAMAFFIFLFGNMGMRFLGFWILIKQLVERSFFSSFNLFLWSITAASFLVPVFFVQKGVAWNAIQFNQYFLLLFGFIAAAATWDLLKRVKNKKMELIISFVIVVLAFPTQLGLLIQFYSNSPLSKISYEEITALNFLENNSSIKDTVLTASFNEYAKDSFEPPMPIYAWYDTGYVSAISKRNTYLADTEQLNIMGYNIDDLIDERRKLFIDPNPAIHNSSDPKIFNEFVEKNKIKFVYLVYGEQFAAPVDKLNIDLIYKTQNVRIYKVRS